MPPSHPPLITIGMPVWNSQQSILASIQSIRAQTYKHWELLILDDGSIDETETLIRQIDDPRIQFYKDGQHLGLPARLNQALQRGRGTYFARMDADDIAYPQRLERQMAFMASQSNIDLVGSAMLVFKSNGQTVGKISPPLTHPTICANPFARLPIPHPTFLGKKEWFLNHWYDEKFLKAQDQELLLRSYRFSKFANLPEILLGYRHEKMSLRKSYQGRRFLLRAQMQEMRRQKKLPKIGLSIIRQTVGAILDTAAVVSGLHHALLPQWSGGTITAQEKAEWQTVWQTANNPPTPLP